MAVADPPSGLMDIASTLAQEEIPMKLRCAICNLLATNAFRLPCCDQSICETCQSSLTDTCPVCAHNPVSPDLCKPNKALRITLKAFLRTEEKKREKDRQAAAAPPTPTTAAPVATEAVVPVESTEQDNTNLPVQQGPDEVANEESKGNDGTTNATPAEAPDESVPGVIPPQPANLEVESTKQSEDLPADPTNPPNPSDVPVNTAEENDITEQGDQAWPEPSPYMPGIGQGGFQGMTWNGSGTFGGMNGMAPFMASSMYNFPNPMGMPMDMDPMAANQGMFGDYGMNMTGMGMNMGMNFNGQNMYGTLGWDGSQQNMWQGGQDKFNPNAFANGTGTPYGGAFGGSNMSYHSNADNQSGYYGPSYGRGGFRGRGRGYYNQGRGSYGGSGMNNFGHGPYAGLPNRPTSSSTTDALNGAPINTDPSSQVVETATGQETGDDSAHADTVPNEATSVDGNGQQLQGIPTIDSLDESASARSSFGYGRGGYTQGPMGNRRGGFMGPIQPHVEPRNPGVEGAPAAPRAMREGRPNTSLLRQYGFHNHTRAPSGSNASPVPVSNDPETPQEPQNQIPVNDPSQPAGAKSRSRSRSPSQNRASRPHSPAQDVQDKPESRRDHDTRTRDRHSRSPSHVSSHQSSRLQHRKTDRDRRNGDQSHRSRRHASRDGSRSPISKNRPSERSEKRETNEHTKSVDLLDTRSLAGRISSNNRSNRDRPSQRKEERSRDRIRDKDRDRDRDRDSHRRDKDRDRERDRRDRDRKTDSDRRQDRDRDRDRARERGRDSGRDREKDRKRTRRDRSETADASEYSSHPKSRRVKRNADDDRARERDNAKSSTSEKDPHTLEREARNQERMMREKQRREKASSGSRRDSRPERVVAGRLINFKYEDEL